jgi:4-nitrophenyl phosphatase
MLSGSFIMGNKMQLKLPSEIKSLILDMDGVLWKDNAPIGDPAATITALLASGLTIVYATNNSSKSADQYIEKLTHFGIPAVPEQIITSGMAVSHLLKQRFPQGGPIFAIGESGLFQTLAEHGFHQANENVLAVVSGFDRQLTYEKLSRASLLIRSGAAFYGTNPDTSYPTPEGLVPGAGAILAAIKAATDAIPEIAGKPFPTMIEFALDRLGALPEETLMIGDRLETDILGGQNAKCLTALVLSGVSTAAELENWAQKPTMVMKNLSSFIQ